MTLATSGLFPADPKTVRPPTRATRLLTRLQGFEPRESPCYHPPGVTRVVGADPLLGFHLPRVFPLPGAAVPLYGLLSRTCGTRAQKLRPAPCAPESRRPGRLACLSRVLPTLSSFSSSSSPRATSQSLWACTVRASPTCPGAVPGIVDPTAVCTAPGHVPSASSVPEGWLSAFDPCPADRHERPRDRCPGADVRARTGLASHRPIRLCAATSTASGTPPKVRAACRQGKAAGHRPARDRLAAARDRRRSIPACAHRPKEVAPTPETTTTGDDDCSAPSVRRSSEDAPRTSGPATPAATAHPASSARRIRRRTGKPRPDSRPQRRSAIPAPGLLRLGSRARRPRICRLVHPGLE